MINVLIFRKLLKWLPIYALLLTLPSLAWVEANAQQPSSGNEIVVHGRVADEVGEPLPGACVFVKGTATGVTTGVDGSFAIKTKPNAVLTFSSLGYITQDIAVQNRDGINVTLMLDSVQLEETVVVGYGSQARKTLTSSVSKVSGDKLMDAPVASVGEALKGKVTGMRVVTNNSVTGNAPRFLIRGGSSVNLTNDPVVIVDGINRSMDDINPNDIESIEVLKDAASAGIYGSRASNGIVLVTTKKGKASQSPEVVFDLMCGLEQPERYWNLMNAKDYVSFLRVANIGGYNSNSVLTGAYGVGTGNSESSVFTTRYLADGETVPQGYQSITDPLDESKTIIFSDHDYQRDWFRNAFYHKEYVGVNGGNDRVQYAASISNLRDNGIIAMSKYNLLTLHGNTSFKITNRLTAGATFDLSQNKTNPLISSYSSSIVRGLQMAPTHRDFDSEGNWMTGGNNVNQQMASFYEAFYDREIITNNMTGTFNLKWEIIDGLVANAQYTKFISSYTGSYYARGQVGGTPNYITTARPTSETRNVTDRDFFNIYLNFDRTFQLHRVTATAGYEYMHQNYKSMNASSSGSVSDKVPYLQSGLNFNATNAEENQALISFFGRVGYEYAAKYLLSANFRADGSSKFAPENRWGYFPSVSAGWVASEENFFSEAKNVMSTLKVRASYGLTGNNSIGLYDTYGSFSNGIYMGRTTLLPSSMQNTGMRWETTRQLDIGLDFGFLKDRFRIVMDYYDKVTDNMLFSITLPDTGSLSSVTANTGSARFYGFEFELNTVNIQTKDFTWSTDFTYSFNKNVVLSLPEEYGYDEVDEYGVLTGRRAYRIGGVTCSESGYRFGGIAVGEPLGQLYSYKISHILQTEAEAEAALYDNFSHGYRRSDGCNDLVNAKYKGRKDVGDYEWVNRIGTAKTADGKEMIDGEDLFYAGNVVPHSTGGLNNTFKWKRLTFSFYFDYAIGHTIYNYFKTGMFQNTNFANSNVIYEVNDCWTHPGDSNAKYARFTVNDVDWCNKNFSRGSDFNYEKGDYLCLRDVSLYYDLPEKWVKTMHMKKFTIGITGNTLHYFTGVTGAINPETGMGTTSSADMYTVVNNSGNSDGHGNVMPATRRILFNLKLTF